MAVVSCSSQFAHELGICKNYGHNNIYKSVVGRGRLNLSMVTLSSHDTQMDALSLHLSDSLRRRIQFVPLRYNMFVCRSSLIPGAGTEIPILKNAVTALTRLYNSSSGSVLVLQLAPAVGIITFALFCLEPLMRHSRNWFLHKSDSSWNKSSAHYVMTSYLQPLLLWFGASLICRTLDPVVLHSETSQAVKQRLLHFVRSLSTVLAIAYCLSSFIQQAQKLIGEMNDSNDTKNMGFEFAGKVVYSAVWVASVSLFMELLGFSTQKWLTAGGLGTVLLTLAGREMITNFLSSVIIHVTQPFVLNEWIQTKIGGYEVSGTVERVGWWSPTIIRGDDREAVHIPNHQFTMNIVRNLSQKTHWRIKTHLAISHLDVKKINNIVADMRKVLAKNPQVEHKKLHRRVFFENVDPENQALLILVSCFVKTSRFEEYLCVKEAVLLDLLRVISHHRARLATPIRTVQKIYGDADVENIPFSDIFTRARSATNRSLLLIEPPYKINGVDKPKSQAQAQDHPIPTTEGEEEEEATVAATPKSEPNADMKVPITTEAKADSKIISTPSDSKVDSKLTAESSVSSADPKQSTSMSASKKNSKVASTSLSDSNSDSKTPSTSKSDLKGQASVDYNGVKENSDKQNSEVGSFKKGVTSSISSPKSQVEAQDSNRPNLKDISSLRSASEKPQVPFSEHTNSKVEQTTLGTSPDKLESEKLPVTAASARPPLGENIVLNVALDDSRQMLPIEEEMIPSPNTKDLAARGNGNESQSAGNDTKVGQPTQSSPVPGAVAGGDQRDQER